MKKLYTSWKINLKAFETIFDVNFLANNKTCIFGFKDLSFSSRFKSNLLEKEMFS